MSYCRVSESAVKVKYSSSTKAVVQASSRETGVLVRVEGVNLGIEKDCCGL